MQEVAVLSFKATGLLQGYLGGSVKASGLTPELAPSAVSLLA